MTPRVDVLGVGFDRLDLAGAARTIAQRLARGERTFAITANPEFVMLARTHDDVARIAREADLVLPDGAGVVVASRVLGDPLPGRAPGRLLVDALLPGLALDGHGVFLLGAAPGVADRAAKRLRQLAPSLRVVGTYAGDADPAADEATVAVVAAAAPTVVLVAFGMPRQERWIARNLSRLPTAKLAMGVGGVFDQLAGVGTVPPPLVHRLGMEWLWRLMREPRRWRRQRALLGFALLVLRRRLLP